MIDLIFVMAGMMPFVAGIYLLELILEIFFFISGLADEIDFPDPFDDDARGWLIASFFYLISAWVSWEELKYYEFGYFIGYWLGVGIMVYLVSWFFDWFKEKYVD